MMASKASSWLLTIFLAAVVCSATAQLPDSFAQPGGPSAAPGMWWGVVEGAPATVLDTQDAYVLVYYLDGRLVAEFGNYTSWECAEDVFGPGGYTALIDTRTIPFEGPEETATFCEVGSIDLQTGIYLYAVSETVCPMDLNEAVTLNRIPPPNDVAPQYYATQGQCGAAK